MARITNIRLRRSATQGAIPTTSSLDLGELAINTYDGKLYLKKSVSGTETIVEVGAGTGLSSSFTLYEYTATSGQTSFSGSDDNSNTLAYDTGTPPKIQVYLNGVLLDYTTDYTATNGTSVTLTNGAVTDDLLQVAAYKSSATFATNLSLSDDQHLYFGDDNDLDIYHNGTRSIINDAGTGDLQFQIGGSAIFDVTTDGIVLNNLDVEANEFIGDLRGAVLFKAQAGEALSKGDVVYISGISGNTTVVMKADADDASKMPAFGVAAVAATANSSIDIYTLGTLFGLDTSSFTEGDELFVSTTAGSLTNTAPTGETAAIQKIAKVTRSDASVGSIFITGAGRSNATPNLDEDQFFLGNASNQAVATDFSDAVEALSINNVVEDTTPQLGGDLASNGNDILFADSDKAIFGTGSDLQIYHTGSNSVITDTGSGDLKIRANNLLLEAYATEDDYLTAIDGGAVTIFYDGSPKLATQSWGVDITGELQADTLDIDGISHLTSNNDATPVRITRGSASTDQVGVSLNAGGNTRYFGKGTDDEPYWATTANISGGSKIVTSGNFTGILDSTYYQSGDDISVGNITATGYLRGPSTFTIDPATHGDDTGTVVIAGNLQVDGTTTTINSTTLTVDDKLITLASGSINAAAADGAGIEVEISGATNPSLTYDGTNDEWDFNKSVNVTESVKIANTNDPAKLFLRDSRASSDSEISQRSDGRISLAAVAGSYGTSGIEILSDGNVGIGTTSPDVKLHLEDASRVDIKFEKTGSETHYIRKDGDFLRFRGHDDNTVLFELKNNTNGNNVCSFPNGNVGIGTTSPNATLHVLSSGNGEIEVERASGALINLQAQSALGVIGTDSNHDLAFKTNSAVGMRLTTSGRVGIGTAAPGNLLDVNDENAKSVIRISRGGTNLSTSTDIGSLDFYADYNSSPIQYGGIKSYSNALSGVRGSLDFSVKSTSGNVLTGMTLYGTSSGVNVGIGTTTPTEILHVKATNGSIAIDANGSGNTASIKFINDNERSRISSNYDTGGGGRLTFHTDTTGGSLLERMRIDNAGNVGIGTANPDKLLTVSGADAEISINDTSNTPLIRFRENGTSAALIKTDSGKLVFTTRPSGGSLTDVGAFDTDGNFGIGTTSPSVKLQVEEYGIDTTETSTTATTQVAIHTFAAATFRSARFTVQVTNSTDSTYHLTEILLIHDGTTPSITEYGTIFTGSAAEATFDADISSGNVRLLATPASTDSMEFKVVSHSITV